MIKVLIVDDSALVRQSFRALLESDPEIKVIATAADPFIAVQKIQKEKPDVITLDVVMPKMDGLTFLQKLRKQVSIPVVMISNQTQRGADLALRALEYGAADIMEKPNLSSEENLLEARVKLVDSVKSAFYAGQKGPKYNPSANFVNKSNTTHIKDYASQTVIAIGASTGGTEAIKMVLQEMPINCPPILIVQHMPKKFTTSFANRLNDVCAIRVKEAEHNEKIEAGTAYIAPGNYHMSVVKSANGKYIKISSGELVNRHRPSVNVLFNSVAQNIGKHAIGLILTGMGDDGATGLKRMHDTGSFTVAQDENTSVVYGMPLRAVQQNAVSKQLPLHDITQTVCKILGAK